MKFISSLLSNAAHYVKHPRNLVSSKIALYTLGVLVLFFAYQTAQVAIKRHQTKQDIQTFEKQVADLQHTKGSLQELNQFLETDFFAEKEARLKLGMQRPGEQVVVLTGKETTGDNNTSNNSSGDGKISSVSSSGTSVVKNSTQETTEKPRKEKSNPGKWWDYFFATDSKNDILN